MLFCGVVLGGVFGGGGVLLTACKTDEIFANNREIITVKMCFMYIVKPLIR